MASDFMFLLPSTSPQTKNKMNTNITKKLNDQSCFKQREMPESEKN